MSKESEREEGFTALISFVAAAGLTLTNSGVGIGISGRIPFTESNITAAASFGHKDEVPGTLPPYVRNRVGGNQNLVNTSETLTIGPFQQVGEFIIGKQEGAPIVDLHISLHH